MEERKEVYCDTVREEEEEEEERAPGSLGKSLMSEQRQRAQATCWPFFTSARAQTAPGGHGLLSPPYVQLHQVDMVYSLHLTFFVEQSFEEELAL